MKRHITNIISTTFGKFASKKFSPPIQKFINNSYVKLLGLDMSEFNSPSSYPTLNALFTRKLKRERDFNRDENILISPSDSLITDCGVIKKDRLTQIKGMSYNFKEMISNNFEKESVEKIIDGLFINFYLSPKDYHRYHSPCDMQVTKLIYIPAKLYPVNRRYLTTKRNLFIENERVILECFDKRGKLFFMVFVGALNVGKMVINFEPRVETNAKELKRMIFNYDTIYLKKGEEIGTFMMGSTIVMLFEKEYGELLLDIGEKVKFGDEIVKRRA